MIPYWLEQDAALGVYRCVRCGTACHWDRLQVKTDNKIRSYCWQIVGQMWLYLQYFSISHIYYISFFSFVSDTAFGCICRLRRVYRKCVDWEFWVTKYTHIHNAACAYFIMFHQSHVAVLLTGIFMNIIFQGFMLITAKYANKIWNVDLY